ncbi:MAG: tRNA pseudouridine(55) synthase TruB [Actinobacteria bacterium]|nr:tRNA pseudouridine(55) synthase TruB [Actinomycetota bacterium]
MSRRKPAAIHGLAVIDKPAGITSHDVVGIVRRTLGERRVGHAGTLDPDATGVLLVGVGNATRLLRFLTVSAVSAADVSRAVDEHLVGPIMQVPPMVSALKVDGRRLHELAREGIEVERQPRPVTVHHFDVEPTDDPLVYRIDVGCSSGTYVRTLAADLGHLLGGGAHLRALRRTACGSFTEAEARPPAEAGLLSLSEALRDYPHVAVDAEVATRVGHGRSLPAWDGDGPWAVCDEAGDLLAVYERASAELAKPAVVIPAA